MTPAQMLEDNNALRPIQIAFVLGLTCTRGRTKGEPDPRKARELIKSGALKVLDPTQPPTRWLVSTFELRRYLTEGPRRGADIIPLRSAS